MLVDKMLKSEQYDTAVAFACGQFVIYAEYGSKNLLTNKPDICNEMAIPLENFSVCYLWRVTS